MRHTLTAQKSRALTGLCAACVPRIPGPSTTIPSHSALATRTFSSHSPPPTQPPHPLTRAPPRRCFSASSQPRVAQQPPTTPEAAAAAAAAATATTPGPPTPLPYYALFPRTLPTGPPPTGPFTIDTRALHREFLQLQAAAHPDFHHRQPAAQRLHAEAASSHINAAYAALAAPLPRAQYLLAQRYSIDLAGDEASARSGPADQSLLMEVMEAREAVEEAATEAELEGVRRENEGRIRECLEVLERAFAEEDVETAVRETVRLRYWMNIRESVHNWEEGKPVILQH